MYRYFPPHLNVAQGVAGEQKVVIAVHPQGSDGLEAAPRPLQLVPGGTPDVELPHQACPLNVPQLYPATRPTGNESSSTFVLGACLQECQLGGEGEGLVHSTPLEQ